MPANGSGSVTWNAAILAAISGSSTSSSTMNSGRTYQRGWSKHRMKVIRYNDSGTTQRNGTLAMFCVTWLLMASSITEPIADNASHISCVPQPGAAAPEAAAACGCDCGESPLRTAAARIDAQPVAAQTITNSV